MKHILFSLMFISFINICIGQKTNQLDSLIKIHQSNGFNGNILYSRNDSIVFKGNYGYANFEDRIPLTDSSVFDLASLSKQFTALGIVQLVEKDLLSLETTLEEIWSDFPYKGITIEHLLRHQSGLPDYMNFLDKKKYWDKNTIATNSDLIKIMTKNAMPLEFPPGTKYVYSNTGYAMLASVIEKISNISFEKYMHKNIFEPLQMSNSKVVRRIYKPDNDSNLTVGYYSKGKKNKPNYLYDKRMKRYDGVVGDGMVHSTILDLFKWHQSLKNNSLISEANKEKMFTGDEVSTTYGFGFVVQHSKSVGKYILHTGEWQGYHTFLLYIPMTDEFIVILSNNSYEGNTSINNDLLKYGR